MTALAELVAPRSTALIVVDIQNDYIHPDGAFAASGQDTSAVIAILPRLRQLIADARTSGVSVVFTRNMHSDVTDNEPIRERLGNKWSAIRRPALADTWGASWYEVEPEARDIIIDKRRYDAFLGTPLELTLRGLGIRTVAMTGTVTNVCVDSTARSAYMRGFHVVLVSDCCASAQQNLHDATLENISRNFGSVVEADALTSAWRNLDVAEPNSSREGRSSRNVATA